MGNEFDDSFYQKNTKRSFLRRWKFVDAVLFILSIAVIYFLLRYLYAKPTPNEQKGKFISKGVHNIADFEKKLGRPIDFNPDKMVPLSKDDDPPECPKFKNCDHKICQSNQDRIVQKNEKGCKECVCVSPSL